MIIFQLLIRICDLSWTSDGRIVFVSSTINNQSIWIMDANGAGKKKLSGDSRVNNFPCVSPDGRYIIYASDRTGSLNLWRMDSDGNNQKQLTYGDSDRYPGLSQNGQWIIYSATSAHVLMKVSIDGGVSVPLTY